MHFNRFCDINLFRTNAKNGKIAQNCPAREVRHRLRADSAAARLVRPGAALETGTARPAVTGGLSVRIGAETVGGTAEGMPFVPGLGRKGFFVALGGQSMVKNAEGAKNMKETLEQIRQAALAALAQAGDAQPWTRSG